MILMKLIQKRMDDDDDIIYPYCVSCMYRGSDACEECYEGDMFTPGEEMRLKEAA